MYRFFIEPEQVAGDHVTIQGSDVNHMKNVLRIKQGELLEVSDGRGNVYQCSLERFEQDTALLQIKETGNADTELPSKLYLFQGLPKSDKMEWIVQKAVELGVSEVMPVVTKRTVVKLDEKKAAKRTVRWNTIAEGAAKQSGRGYIPVVREVCSFKEALELARDLDVLLIPYEKAEGMAATKQKIADIQPGQSVGIFIGPEGGFEETEVEQAAAAGAFPITLGKRILRTETAGMTVLSILMYHLEA